MWLYHHNMKIKQFLFGILSVVVFASAVFWGARMASADPNQPPGSGSGAISASGNDLGIGGSASNGIRLKVVASTSNNTTYGLQVLQNNGGYILTARGDGYVGVGTSSPTYPLSVQGTIQAAGGSFIGTLAASNVSAGVFASGNSAFQSALGIGTNSTVGLPTNGLYVVGNVGIGTTTPLESLVVMGSVILQNNGAFKTYDSAGGNKGILRLDNANPDVLHLRNDQRGVGGSISFDSLAGGLASMTILNSGNVGIGTTTPSYRLESLQGSGGTLPGINIVEQNTTNRRATLGFGLNSGATSGWVMGQSFGNNTNKDFYLYDTSNSAYRLLVSTSGNVGIGTTTPGSPLTVAGVIYSSTGGFKFPDGTTQSTAVSGSGTTTAANISAGQFGASVGNGDFSFPGTLNVSSTLTVASGTLRVTTVAPGLGGGTGLLTLEDSAAMAADVGGNISFRGKYTNAGATAGFGGIKAGKNNSTDSNLDSYLSFSTRSQAGGVAEKFRIDPNGYVGIGTTTPSSKLDVTNGADEIMRLSRTGATYPNIFKLGTDGALVINNNNSDVLTLKSGNIGIGTATANARLSFVNNVATGFLDTYGEYQMLLYDGASALGSYGLGIKANTMVFNSGAGAYSFDRGGAATTLTMDTSGKVGIGTSTPAYTFEVVSGGATTARFGTAAADTVIIGGGTGKINVGTVDPIYTIGGERYATYLPAMTGQKEETTGNLQISCRPERSEGQPLCSKEIDFSNLSEGSDLWLFAKVTNLVNNFNALTVLLTPGFDGRVWYEKLSGNKLIIHGSTDGEVSYRLTAPRFDFAKWGNRTSDQEEGFNLDKLIK